MQFERILNEKFPPPDKTIDYKFEKMVFKKDNIQIYLNEEIDENFPLRYILQLFICNNLVNSNFAYRLSIKNISHALNFYYDLFLKYFENVYTIRHEDKIIGVEVQKLSTELKRILSNEFIEKLKLANNNIFNYDNESFNIPKYQYIHKLTNSNCCNSVLSDWIHIIENNIEAFGYDGIPFLALKKDNIVNNILVNTLISEFNNVYLITSRDQIWHSVSIIVSH